MCGIAGFIDFTKKQNIDTLKKVTNLLVHRGPDDCDYKLIETENANIGLGHRRLSIIDLSNDGRQPMSYANGRYTIVFNGEIYNYKEIRKMLESMGYLFNTKSDTEVILASFDKWGTNCVDHFIGMFAFFIYDSIQNHAFLFRDRAGVKPFFYTYSNDEIVFGSELKSIMHYPNFKKDIDNSSLAYYLQYGYITAPYSIFKNTFKLRPGHFLNINLSTKSINEQEYWDVKRFYNYPKLKIDEHDAIIETEKLLKSAFQYRMIADVPIGIFLSGGYDSSSVAAILQANSTQRLNTFTIGFDEEKYNEAVYAKKVAEHLGTNHTEQYCTTKQAQDIIPRLPYFYDEPFGDSSAIPTMLVSELARKHVTVALSADAGDEIFAGYNLYSFLYTFYNKKKYFPPKLISIIHECIKRGTHSFPNIRRLKNAQTLSTAYSTNSIESFRNKFVNRFSEYQLQKIFKRPVVSLEIKKWTINNNDLLDTIQGLDYETYLPDDILTKVDRATMATSLEGREPFLDHRIIEFAAQLPNEYKFSNGNKKYILKQITHKYIPKQLMERPKMGFGVPVVKWMRKDLKYLMEIYLNQNTIEQQDLFEYKVIEDLKKNYYAGNDTYFEQLWFILMFQMWRKEWNV